MARFCSVSAGNIKYFGSRLQLSLISGQLLEGKEHKASPRKQNEKKDPFAAVLNCFPAGQAASENQKGAGEINAREVKQWILREYQGRACATRVLDGGKAWQKVSRFTCCPKILSSVTIIEVSSGLTGLPGRDVAYPCSRAAEQCYVMCSKGHIEVPNMSVAGAVYSP